MPTPLLATKLYIPTPRRTLVPRPRLLERLDADLHRRLTFLSAPAGSWQNDTCRTKGLRVVGIEEADGA
jgi:ATP/maltotriose-dependent transcriptional regulator MalT